MPTAPRSKNRPGDESAEAGVKQRIVAEARARFLAHGFRGVTMDDLAAELAMSKKTLYAHFASKSVLLKAVLEDKLSAVDAGLGRLTAGSTTDFLQALSQLLGCVRQHSDELQPPFLRDLTRETPELFKRVQIRRRAIIRRHFGKLLAAGRKAGRIRKDITIDLMIEILLGATDALITPQKLSHLSLSAKTALSAIITIFLKGVVTDQGRKKR
jgi:AcrR family transcriptional regulator